MTSYAAWEYSDFVFSDWQPSHTWVSLASQDRYAEPLARQFFWQTFESLIRDHLEEWQVKGWEQAAEIGPNSLRLRKVEYKGAAVDPSDIVLWVATLGFALMIHFVLRKKPRTYVRYEPLEFRVRMRRSQADFLR